MNLPLSLPSSAIGAFRPLRSFQSVSRAATCAIALALTTPCVVSASVPGSWTTGPSLNFSRRAPAVIARPLLGPDALVYAFGGHDEIHNPVATCEVWFPGDAAWNLLAGAMPTPRYGAAVVDFAGEFWVIGGFNNFGMAVRNVESFDPMTGMWTVRNLLSAPRGGASAAAVGGTIYLFGGSSSDGGPTFTNVYEFAPGPGNWNSTGASLPAPLAWASCSEIGSAAYLAGGETTPGTGLTALNSFTIPTTFTPLAALPAARSHGGSAAINDFLYLSGGYDSAPTAPITQTDVYDVMSNTWQLDTPCPAGLSNAGIASGYSSVLGDDDFLYVVGGQDNTSFPVATLRILSPTKYELDVITVGDGTVDASPLRANYTRGMNVQLTATPDPGGTFMGWSGDASGTTNPLDLRMDGDHQVTATFSTSSAVDGPGAKELSLSIASANPARGGARFAYTVDAARHVRLSVVDLAGREVALLANYEHAPGRYETRWDAAGAAPGLYFVRCASGEDRLSERLMLLE